VGKKTNKWWLILMLALSACGHSDLQDGTSSAEAQSQDTKESAEAIDYTNIVSNPSEMRAGDILFVGSKGTGNLDFSGVESDATFTLIMGTAAVTQQTQALYVSSDEVVEAVESDLVVDLDGEKNLQEEFHDQLRDREIDLAISEQFVEETISFGKAVAQPSVLSEGDEQTFRVLSSLTSGTSYTEVTATADCIGQEVVFFVDSRVSESVLSQSDIDALCTRFDLVAAREQALFGEASDINKDGKVVVLMTPQVNKLGGMGGGIITGFFNAADLMRRSASNPVSNEQEILFIMVPDPAGQYGTSISRSFAMDNLLPTVLPHELQHAISYHLHVLKNKGTVENSCLNEGLSHLAEDLMGHGQENPSRYNLYLRSPSSYPMGEGCSANLATRGGYYLFLRYLYEQHADGDIFIQRLLDTSLTGSKNIENAFAGSDKDFDSFAEFFMRWQTVLVLSNSGLTKDVRFNYEERVRNSETDEWGGVSLNGEAEDGRGTVLRGVTGYSALSSGTQSLRSGSSKFFRLNSVPESLELDMGSDDQSFGVLIRTE